MLLRAFWAQSKSLLFRLLLLGFAIGGLEGLFILAIKMKPSSLGIWGFGLVIIVTLRSLLQILALRIELSAVKKFLGKRRDILLEALRLKSIPIYRPPWIDEISHALGQSQENLGLGITALFHCLTSMAQGLILIPLLFLFSPKFATMVLVLAIPILLISRLRVKVMGQQGKRFEGAQRDSQTLQKNFAESCENQWGNGRIESGTKNLGQGLNAFDKETYQWELAKGVFPPLLEWFFFLVLAGLFSLLSVFSSEALSLNSVNQSFDWTGVLPFGALILLLYRPMREWARYYPVALLGEQAWQKSYNLQVTLEKFPLRKAHPQNDIGAIQISHLSFGYSHHPKENPQRWIYEDWNKILDPHQITWITGPNGSGKTTLLKLLAGIEIPQSGIISVPKRVGIKVGKDLESEKDSSRQDFVLGYLSQKAIVEADWLGWQSQYEKENPEIWKRLSVILGINSILLRRRKGNTGDSWIAGLSGGERQRLALARAFASPCDYLLLDEPTTWLSAADRNRIMGDLLAFWQDREIENPRGAAIVSHELAIGEFCSQTLHIELSAPV